MSTPLVSLHHGVQISLPMRAPLARQPSFAATVPTPALTFSFAHSPLVLRLTSPLLPSPPLNPLRFSISLFLPSLPILSVNHHHHHHHYLLLPLFPFSRTRRVYSTSPRRVSLLPGCCTNNTAHACEFHFSSRRCTIELIPSDEERGSGYRRPLNP